MIAAWDARRRRHTRWWVYALLVGLPSCSSQCGKVPKPSSDSTPPNLSWHVENLVSGNRVDIMNSGSYAAKPGDTLRIRLTAYDPEGIQKITLDGGYTVECRHPTSSLAQNLNGVYFPEQQTLSPDASGMVLTSIFIMRTYEYVTTCNQGFVFKKTTAVLKGAGYNYFSGVSTGTLNIVIFPQ
jgi:hypothetical protein